jgi:signal transduction histidine kinase/CheY-like chemotaxis protein
LETHPFGIPKLPCVVWDGNGDENPALIQPQATFSMSDILIESVRLGMVSLLLVFILGLRRYRSALRQRGANFVVVGLALLWLGCVIGLAEHSNSFNGNLTAGGLEAVALLTKLTGHLGGFIVITWGLIRWLPRVAAVNDLEEAHRQLEQRNLELHTADQSKDEFLANMSHEIRTPMTAILGYADLLMQPDLPQAERHEALVTIRQNGKHLLTLINDILDLSKVQAGKLHLEQMVFSPQRLVEEVASLMRVRAIERHLSFAIEYPQAIPKFIHTDSTRLRQILVNLVGNAIKFTRTGGIRLRVDLDRADPQHTALLFHVIDSGIGISKADQIKLFEPFSQADPSVTRKFGGTGLGLAICKRLAQLMNAQILVRSKPGQGSVFTLRMDIGPVSDDQLERCVTLLNHPDHEDSTALDDTDVLSLIDLHSATPRPAGNAPPPTSTAAAAAPAAASGAPGLLVAEDSPDIQALLRAVLQRFQVKAHFVDNGVAAVQTALAAHNTGRPFPLILMDMQMPKMDGFHAAAELRKAGYLGPIVAMTAHAMDGDRSRCMEAGCTDYLSKPLDFQLLQDVLCRYLGAQIGGDPLDRIVSSADVAAA